MSSPDRAPAAPATTRRMRLPRWLVAPLAIAVVPWLVYWIAIDPASPRWDGIDSLFLWRGPVTAAVAFLVTLRLLVGVIRHWRAEPSEGDASWLHPVARGGGVACLALYVGLTAPIQFGEALADHRLSRLLSPPADGADEAVIELLRFESLHEARLERARWTGVDGRGRWVRQVERRSR